MKLHQLKTSTYQFGNLLKAFSLSESILDYFALEIDKLKHKDDPFSERSGIDTEKLSRLISALKILSDKDTRSVLTLDDIGIDVNSIKAVRDVLDNYNTSGKNGKQAEEVIFALSSLSSRVKKEVEDKINTAKNSNEKSKVIVELNKLYDKAKRLMDELRNKADVPKITTSSISFA